MFQQLSSLSQTRFFLSIREAFIAVVPFMLLLATVGVLQQLALSLHWLEPHSFIFQQLHRANAYLTFLFPLLIVISISFYYCKNLNQNSVVGSLLGVCCFLVNSNYLTQLSGGTDLPSPQQQSAYYILMPIVSSYLFAFLARQPWLALVKQQRFNRFLYKHINYVLPFTISFLLLFLLTPKLTELFSALNQVLFAHLSDMAPMVRTAIRVLLSHLFWLLGVHGDQMIQVIDGQAFYHTILIDQVTVTTFLNTFVYIGGSGACWGLLLACLLQQSKCHEKSIAKLSLPLTVFNVNEILIYALPIVLNPIFVIPFVLVPLLNLGLSLLAVHWQLISLSEQSIEWVTPIFLDAWLLGRHGSTVMFQLGLVALNTLIYLPFVSWSVRNQSVRRASSRLENHLSVVGALEESAEPQFMSVQQKSAEQQRELNAVLKDIEEGQLQMYYQPKVSNKTGKFSGFEALIRLRNRHQKIVGPYFLEALREHQLTHIVDYWVIQKVQQDLDFWAEANFHPHVSINIEPQTLNEFTVKRLIERFSNFPNQIEIEILESGYARNPLQFQELIAQLQQHNIQVAMDDFGTGYSNISNLAQSRVNTIKLDLSLLRNIDNQRNKDMYLQLVILCKKLGFYLIAEGVETQVHYDFIRTTLVDESQGWFIAKALPREDARQFALQLVEENQRA